MSDSKRQRIDDALRENTRLRIRYTDLNGQISTREITPRAWEGRKLIAYCHEREDERNFFLDKIVLLDDEGASRAVQHDAPDETSQAVVTRVQPNEILRPLPTEPTAIPPSAFSAATTAEHWQRLIQYFAKCVKIENGQLAKLTRGKQVLFMPLDPVSARRFLDKRLEFNIKRASDKSLFDFITDPQREHEGEQLYFGHPLFMLHGNRFSPLMFAPVSIVKTGNTEVNLRADEMEISYTALEALELDDEAIEGIFSECSRYQYLQDAAAQIEAVLVKHIDACFEEPVRHVDQTQGMNVASTPFSIYEGPCLFWADAQFTRGLLEELQELSVPTKWSTLPTSLRQMISQVPPHDYHADASNESAIYLTQLNPEQKRAVNATRTEPLTVVTGPPGTGKSQLILNIIGDAVMRGERVLFASHNNEAVNVVVNRLGAGVGFRGAVRMGNRTQWQAAGQGMLAALDWIEQQQPEPIGALRHQYKTTEQHLHAIEGQLADVRAPGRLEGLERECDLLRRSSGKLQPTAHRHTVSQKPTTCAQSSSRCWQQPRKRSGATTR
ncbi:MAG: AAA family ATPase [Blastochloris sp.]|nr:AAA family ATPase [Blastochloris sp.]